MRQLPPLEIFTSAGQGDPPSKKEPRGYTLGAQYGSNSPAADRIMRERVSGGTRGERVLAAELAHHPR